LYLETYRQAKALEQKKQAKQGNYIQREQEYRQVIESLKAQIEAAS